jgi:hypothetical protein
MILDYSNKLTLINSLFENTNGFSIIEQVIYKSGSRQEIAAFKEELTMLSSILNQINGLEDFEAKREFLVGYNYNLSNITLNNFVSEYTSFKDYIDENYQSHFYNFAYELNKWNDSEWNFNNKLFQDGFCNIPLDLINAFRQKDDIDWGGLDWSGSVVDYMHFEIEESKTGDYLK